MSRVTELAEAEADRVEAEEAAAEPAEPEPPAEPAEPEPPAEPESELPPIDPKLLEKAITAHEKAMRRVLGEAFEDLTPCATCDGVGYTPPNTQPVPELKHDPMTETCEACNGWGQVLTGALEGANPLRPCTSCNGGGYTTKALTLTPTPAVTFTPGVSPGAAEPNGAPVPIDPTTLEALRRSGYTIIEPYPGS